MELSVTINDPVLGMRVTGGIIHISLQAVAGLDENGSHIRSSDGY